MSTHKERVRAGHHRRRKIKMHTYLLKLSRCGKTFQYGDTTWVCPKRRHLGSGGPRHYYVNANRVTLSYTLGMLLDGIPLKDLTHIDPHRQI